MRKMMIALVAMLTIAATGKAMSYEQARNEALFLTDKMAYELNLTDAQYEAAYEINLDYLMGVTSYDDVFGTYWERRNMDLSYILLDWQWKAFCAATYFFRPLYWSNGFWHFGIYARYPHRDYFFYGRPAFYVTYRGGHAWHRVGGYGYYHGRRDYFRNTSASRRSHFDRPTHHRPISNTTSHHSNRLGTGSDTHHSNRPNVGSNTHHSDRPNHSDRPSTSNNRPEGSSNTVHSFDRSRSSGTFSSRGGINSSHSSSHSSGTFSSSGSRNGGSISNTGNHSSGSFSRNSGGTFSSSHSSGGSFSSHSSGTFSRAGGSSSHNSGASRSSGGGHSYGGRR